MNKNISFYSKGVRMLEKQIEKRVCEYAKTLGFLPYKFTSPNRAAVPDRLFIGAGMFFFIEFKAQGKKPTSAQVREITRILDQRIPCFVVDNVVHGHLVVTKASQLSNDELWELADATRPSTP